MKILKSPVCRSLERHRLIWLYLTRKTDLMQVSLWSLMVSCERWTIELSAVSA